MPDSIGLMCPACGAMMYRARLLKGYDKTGPEADRLTCALHGPQGRFRYIATDRASCRDERSDQALDRSSRRVGAKANEPTGGTPLRGLSGSSRG